MIEATCQRITDASGHVVTALRKLASDRSEVWQVRFDGAVAVLTQRAGTDYGLPMRDFDREVAHHRRAANAQLAPKLLWVDIDARVFISEWGQMLSSLPEQTVHALGRQLATLHRLSVSDQSKYAQGTLTDAARAYAACAAQQQPMGCVAEQLQCVVDNEVARGDTDTVLCHRDPVPGNILGTKRPRFIDWEYAGPASRWFDLAVVIDGFHLDTDAQRVLQQGYASVSPAHQPSPDAIARERETNKALGALWQAALPAIA